jgi:hypothetical protein
MQANLTWWGNMIPDNTVEQGNVQNQLSPLQLRFIQYKEPNF